MNPALVAGVWILVTLDCSLMGYRLAMGRVAVLDKRRYFQLAAVRGALLAQVPLAIVTSAAISMTRRAGATVTSELDDAMVRFLLVGGTYAALILGACLLCLVPSVTVRTAASVVIFGPLTLLRPVVVIATVAAAVGTDPSTELLAIGLLVAVPGVAIEPLLDRRIARRQLT